MKEQHDTVHISSSTAVFSNTKHTLIYTHRERVQAHVHPHLHTRTHTHIPHTHTQTHTHTHHTRTQTHKQTHTHQPCSLWTSWPTLLSQ